MIQTSGSALLASADGFLWLPERRMMTILHRLLKALDVFAVLRLPEPDDDCPDCGLHLLECRCKGGE